MTTDQTVTTDIELDVVSPTTATAVLTRTTPLASSHASTTPRHHSPPKAGPERTLAVPASASLVADVLASADEHELVRQHAMRRTRPTSGPKTIVGLVRLWLTETRSRG